MPCFPDFAEFLDVLDYGLLGIGVPKSPGSGANKPMSLQDSAPTRWNNPPSAVISSCTGVASWYVLSTVILRDT
jgi:hypothetical protein